MAQFSDILLSLREEKEIGQKDLADLLKLTKGSISNYEKGKFEPDISSIKALADFFDVSTDYLLGVSSSSLAYKHLGEKYISDATYGDVFKQLSKIPQKHRETVLLVISALSEYLSD
ncbi:MAG: helix-turn-helix transcriptional regulator [Lachnospiraceae bacterium]